ncbi:hypothetical protein F2Q70_00028845 [Brassica cretica]|uniref:Uncharacterized protein n=1 Tax=Brassica cretica TaxID=69181 RepID=A0A8S9LBZ2_BRACR|nr:hypothetical protein F2Q70_00028845 [Brassica cretica]
MDDREGSFVAVRRISQGLERGSVYNSSSAEGVPGSAAWLGRGLSCVCAQRRDSDTNSTFDLTPAQEECLQSLQNRIDVAYDSTIPLHQISPAPELVGNNAPAYGEFSFNDFLDYISNNDCVQQRFIDTLKKSNS